MGYLKDEILEKVATSEDNIVFEEAVYNVASQAFSKVMREVFEDLDKRLVAKMHADGYTMERKEPRHIQFLFGDVYFERRLWKKSKKYVYPLDELMGFLPRLRYSPLVQAKLSELATSSEFRKVSKAVSCLTPLQISPSGVHGIVQRVSKKVENHENNTKELVHKEKKVVPVLYLEGDALAVKSQDRGITNINRFQVHEGVEKSGKRGYCVNLHQFSGRSRKKAFSDMLEYLRKNYDLRNTIILSNSDGGSGYEPEVFYELALDCKQHEHFLDRYHLNRKIRERMYFCPIELVDKMTIAVREYSKQDVELVLDTMESIATNENDSKKARKYTSLLRKYLERNWKYIRPLRLRNIPTVIDRGGLGVCESRHRPFSYRMKRQGRSWRRPGAENMVRLITSLQNKEYDEAVRSDWKKTLRKLDEVDIDFNKLLRTAHEPHVGVKTGRILNDGGSRTAQGKIKRTYG